jgi:ferredoxin--NADP+ reductase
MSFVEAKVIGRTDWTDGLWTLQLDCDLAPFRPGQWVNVALRAEDGELLRRAYSIASAPGAPVEFLMVRVDDGALTPLLDRLRVGDTLLVEREPQGFFTLDYVPQRRDVWLVATGTGLGPYLSMIRDAEIWNRFENVIVVHGVRYGRMLAHRDELAHDTVRRKGRMHYVVCVSRETFPGALPGRISTAVRDGTLERAAGFPLEPAYAHVMLCGNPEMVRDLTQALGERGMRRHRSRRPGHISTEGYW